MYKIRSTKIPDYLRKQGRQKLEMHRMTPNWTWTLNNDKYCAGTKNSGVKFWSILLHDDWYSRYKVARNSEMHRMTPKWTWTLNSPKNSIYTKYLPLGPFHSTISRSRDTTCTRLAKSKMHRMTPNWIWTFNGQKYSIYTKNLPPGPNFGPFRSTTAVPRYKAVKNWKCTEPPQTELEHLTAKSTLYTLNAYPWGPNLGLFRSTNTRFRDTRSSKIGNAPSDPKLNWPLNSQKYLTLSTYPWGPHFVPFALRAAVSKISHIL